jgi:hypothetical protein
VNAGDWFATIWIVGQFIGPCDRRVAKGLVDSRP